jgi:hypothetical protein
MPYFPVLNFAPTGLLMIRMMDRLLILAKTFSEKLFETEWVESEHVNKTGLMLQLETQIHDVTSQLDLATKKNQLHKHLQSNLEQLRNRLSNELRSRRFKLEPEQCSPKISIKRYNT